MFKVARFIAYSFLALFGLVTLGNYFPTIPVVGELGSMLTARFGPWIIILSLLGTIWTYRRWRTNDTPRAVTIAALAASAAIGMTYIHYSQIKAATVQGARIDLPTALLASSQSDKSLKVETILYAKHGPQELPIDLYRPTARTDGKSAPIFIYIHGGGWGAETLKQRQADFRWFAERGYLVMSFEYPLSSEKQATWHVTHPLLGCALVWANANAARFGGDASRLALWGESAGGNLALNVAYMANAGTLKPPCTGSLPRVAAVAGLYPVIDAARMHQNTDLIAGTFARIMTKNYTGGSPSQYPDRYAAINPTTHISAKAPPTLLIIPESDHLLAADAAYAFEGKVRAAGVKTRLIRMPFAEHSFDGRSGSIGNQMVRQTMLAFLADQGLKP